ncbi:MAG: hypothetical protein IT373_02560 [Polyangiaceae bacterium]|nr:hypothetical protein [Polyangiaceae bacterium]
MQPATRTLPRGALCAAIAASVVTSAVARAGEPDSVPGHGPALVADHDYMTAIRPPLQVAATERPTAESLLALGLADAAHGLVRAASASCREALRLANQARDENRAREAFACAESADRRVAYLVVRGAPEGPTALRFHGGAPDRVGERFALDPGTAVVTAHTSEGALEPAILELGEGEECVLDLGSLARAPDEPPRPRPPVAWSARSMSLPAGMMSVGASGFFSLLVKDKPKQPYYSPGDGEKHPDIIAPGWAVSVRGAFSDDLALEGIETFSMGYQPGDLLLRLAARLLPGDFEIGLEGTGRIPALRASAGGGYLALRGSGRPDGVLRVDASVGLGAVQQIDGRFGGVGLIQPVGVAMGDVLPVAPGVALGFTLTPDETFFFGLDTGFGLQSFVEPGSMFVPMGLRLGGTVPVGEEALVDIELRGSLPYLLMPVRGDEDFLPPHKERELVADAFWITLGAEACFYP